MIHFRKLLFPVCALVALGSACSSPSEEPPAKNNTPVNTTPGPGPDAVPTTEGSDQPAAPGEPNGTPSGGPIVPPDSEFPSDFIDGDEPPPPPEKETDCARASTPSSLVRLVLTFVFDVSGSMGTNNPVYYSRALKWDPVVAATKAFFADSASVGVSATLTFFPNESSGGGFGGGGGGFGGGGAGGNLCTAAGYSTADVPLTPLPSDAFAAAIDAVTPPDDSSWRSGTPTGPALEGTIAQIRAMQQQDPTAQYVIVLVTDGAPSSCSMLQNDINNVAAIAGGVSDTIKTYVIGVENPVTPEEPNPPIATDNLHLIAEMGGTERAFVIDTANPEQTVTSFRGVIEQIRENSFSCSVEIPTPPDGEEFDKTKVNVGYTNMMGTTDFVYDEACASPTGWRYDSAENPTVIELCEAACQTIKDDAMNEGELGVQLGCVTRVPQVN